MICKMKKLRYEKYNGSNSVITIDLHNGYTIAAIPGFDKEKELYAVTLFLKDNSIDDLRLIEKFEKFELKAERHTINSVILKQVSSFFKQGFFDYYIKRFKYEIDCFEKGNAIEERKRLKNAL